MVIYIADQLIAVTVGFCFGYTLMSLLLLALT